MQANPTVEASRNLIDGFKANAALRGVLSPDPYEWHQWLYAWCKIVHDDGFATFWSSPEAAQGLITTAEWWTGILLAVARCPPGLVPPSAAFWALKAAQQIGSQFAAAAVWRHGRLSESGSHVRAAAGDDDDAWQDVYERMLRYGERALWLLSVDENDQRVKPARTLMAEVLDKIPIFALMLPHVSESQTLARDPLAGVTDAAFEKGLDALLAAADVG